MGQKTLGDIEMAARQMVRAGKSLDHIVEAIGADVVEKHYQAKHDVAIRHIESGEIIDLTWLMDQV